MKEGLQIFIQYKVKRSFKDQYEKEMNHILSLLPEFGADQIQWFLASEEDEYYVEMYKVPTVSHHIALKRMRMSREHQIFGSFNQLIDGGPNAIQYWALKS